MCEELKIVKREAVRVFREVKKIRRSRDGSFYEDPEMNHEKHKSINAVPSTCSLGMRGNRVPRGTDPS
jgi:hypothetical protein